MIYIFFHEYLYRKSLKRTLVEIVFTDKRSFTIKIVAIVLFVILTAMVTWPYYQVFKELGGRLEEIRSMLPRLLSWVSAPSGSWLWNGLCNTKLPMYWEHHLFIGIIPLLATLFVPIVLILRKKNNHIRRMDQRLVLMFLTQLAIVLLVSFYSDSFLPYRYFAKIPGVSSVRAVSRVQLVLIILNVFSLAYIIDCLSDRFKNIPIRLVNILSIILLLGLFIDQGIDTGSFTKTEARERLNNYEKYFKLKYDFTISRKPIIAVLSQEGVPDSETQIDGMLVAQDLGTDTINGYSGQFPKILISI